MYSKYECYHILVRKIVILYSIHLNINWVYVGLYKSAYKEMYGQIYT